MNQYEMILGADTANMQAGGKSFFDASTDFFSMGVGSAVLSGAQSIANTAIDFKNALFGGETERYDTLKTLEDFNDNWAQYYKENKDLVDTTGFVLGSVVPGTLGMKALKLAQEGYVGGAMKSVFGFASTKRAAYLEEALQDVATQGGTVFNAINKNKLLSMAWGTADQALNAAAYETATALTMKSSPLLEKEEWKDIVWDITKTSLLGGAVGGGIEALLTNKIVKDAGKLVAAKQREYDRLVDAGKGGLLTGDRAFSIFEAVTSLPKEVLDPMIPFKYAANGKLDVSALMSRTVAESVERGLQKIETELIDISGVDKTVGKAMAKAIVSYARTGLKEGANEDQVRSHLGDLLFGLRSANGIGKSALDLSGETVWLNPAAIELKDTFAKAAVANGKPFRVIGDEADAKIATLGKDVFSKEEAIARGYDLILDPQGKKIEVSPFSTIYQSLTPDEAKLAPLFFNTRTLTTSTTAVPTIADVATVKNALLPGSISSSGISAGNHTFLFKVSNFDVPKDADTVWFTARHLWADKLEVIRGDIASNDFSLLDALLKNPAKATEQTRVFDINTKRLIDWADVPDKEAYVFAQKRSELTKLLDADPSQDLRALAYRTNVDERWLQDSLETNFRSTEGNAWRRDSADYMDRENLILHYDTSGLDLASFKAEGITAYYQRVKQSKQLSVEASTAVLGKEWSGRLLELQDDIAKLADQQPVGPTMLGASNAGYGDRLRQWAQYTGSLVARMTTERVNAALTEMQAPAARLLVNKQAAAEVSAAMTMLRRSTNKYALYEDSREGYMLVDLYSFKQMKNGAAPVFKERFKLSEDAGEFFAAHQKLHANRIEQQGVLATSQGIPKRWDPDAFYVPPIDTRRTPYFAFVKRTDGEIFGESETAMLTARSAAELQQKAAQIPSGFRVIYKANTEEYFKAKGDYDYGRVMNAPEIDSFLKKEGKLGDFIPNMTPEAVVEDFVQYTQRAETKLVRDAVSVRYGQQINELEDLSKRYAAPQDSAFRGLDKYFKPVDPFGDTIKMALNVSKQGSFTLWHQANEFVDSAGKLAYRGIEAATLEARKGKISWQDAQAQMEKFGVGPVLTEEHAFNVAQTGTDRNLLKIAFNKANMLLVNGMLRLDIANSIMNVLSTPILLGAEVSSLRRAFQNDPELQALWNKMLTVSMPGTEVAVPTASRLLFNAVGNYVGKDRKALLDRFVGINVVPEAGAARMFHEVMDELSLTPNLVPSKFSAKADELIEKGAKFSLSNRAEEMTRFVTADVMRQITDPIVAKKLMTVQEQNSWINSFVNRVQGNYNAAQRPIVFQGTLGSAVGLFQTYQFNMLQQIFRHIENKDKKTLAVLAGMQTSLYGLHGLPFFEALNTNIIGNAAINEGHSDLYAASVKAFGKDMGDWMMYGTASAMPLFGDKGPALWSRGDMNPRNMTLLPTNPADLPSVQAVGKVIGAVTTMAKQIGDGAGVLPSLLFGLEHNGINRPLAGLAQVAKGTSTTNGGDLISAAQDMNAIATAARLIGAKPLDESIGLNTLYRSKAYQAMDRDKIEGLGLVVKQKIRSGEEITAEDWQDLMGKYAARGGRIEGFAQAVQRWNKQANTSVINLAARHAQTPAGQRMVLLMGGTPIEDLTNQPAPE